MVDEAIKVLNSSLLWSIMKASTPEGQTEEMLQQVEMRRDELRSMLEEYALGRNSAKESVKREVSSSCAYRFSP